MPVSARSRSVSSPKPWCGRGGSWRRRRRGWRWRGVRLGPSAQAAIAPSVAQARAQQDGLRAQLQGLTTRLGSNHPDVINLRRQVAEAERTVAAETGRVVAATEADTRAARERMTAVETDLYTSQLAVDRDARAQVPLAAIERDADAARTLLQAVLERSQQIGQQAAVEAPICTRFRWRCRRRTPARRAPCRCWRAPARSCCSACC